MSQSVNIANNYLQTNQVQNFPKKVESISSSQQNQGSEVSENSKPSCLKVSAISKFKHAQKIQIDQALEPMIIKKSKGTLADNLQKQVAQQAALISKQIQLNQNLKLNAEINSYLSQAK